jgi:hypothetical protein
LIGNGWPPGPKMGGTKCWVVVVVFVVLYLRTNVGAAESTPVDTNCAKLTGSDITECVSKLSEH